MHTAAIQFKVSRWVCLPAALNELRFRRALARMMAEPTDRRWLTREAGLRRREIDLLLRDLEEQDALQIIRPPHACVAPHGPARDTMAHALQRAHRWLTSTPTQAFDAGRTETAE